MIFSRICIALGIVLISVGTQSHASDLDVGQAKALPSTKDVRDANQKTPPRYEHNSKLGPFIAAAMTPSFSPTDAKIFNNRFADTGMTRSRADGRLQIYLHLDDVDEWSLEQLAEAGVEIEVSNQNLKVVQGWADYDSILDLTELGNVNKVTSPKFAISYQGSVTTEADEILQSDELRQLGVSGKGVKVGIISDGSNDFRDAIASGDLPDQITRFGSCSKAATTPDPENCNFGFSGSCNEGTAMAEIIHDLAPEAELAIASASTSLEFLQAAEFLATDFGADIIVDDLGFLGEPVYEDGFIAQQIDQYTDSLLWVSSAGNNAAIHYESFQNFVPLTGAFIPGFHNFDPSGEDPFHGFIVRAGLGVRIIMQWREFEQPYANSLNDHNILIFNVEDPFPVVETTFDNRGTFAFETACIFNPSAEDEVFFVVLPRPDSFLDTGGDLTLFFLGTPAMEYPRARGSIFGHSALSKVLTVGTINASEPGNDEIAFYSSQGPVSIFDPNPANNEIRQKPDITGIDGVSVTGTGGFSNQFFGTSAAAPHVAGVAALLMSVPFSSQEAVREAISEGAVDLGVNGRDNVYGHGRINALLARQALRTGNPLPAIFLLLDEEED